MLTKCSFLSGKPLIYKAMEKRNSDSDQAKHKQNQSILFSSKLCTILLLL